MLPRRLLDLFDLGLRVSRSLGFLKIMSVVLVLNLKDSNANFLQLQPEHVQLKVETVPVDIINLQCLKHDQSRSNLPKGLS